MSSAAALSWFARHEIRLAWREWLAMMTAGRRLRKRSAIIGLIVFAAIMHLPAYAVVGRFANLAGAARQIHPHRHHRDDLPGMGPDAVAGDRIGDAGVLRPRRSRSDHVVAGGAGQCIFGSHRGDRADRHGDGAGAVDAFRRCPRDRRRHPMVRGLRRRRRHRPVRRSGCHRHDDHAVPPDRPEPDPAGRANPRRHHRRRLRDRAADRRHHVLRHAVAVRGSDLRRRGGLCAWR